jgi:hypothetical protein
MTTHSMSPGVNVRGAGDETIVRSQATTSARRDGLPPVSPSRFWPSFRDLAYTTLCRQRTMRRSRPAPRALEYKEQLLMPPTETLHATARLDLLSPGVQHVPGLLATPVQRGIRPLAHEDLRCPGDRHARPPKRDDHAAQAVHHYPGRQFARVVRRELQGESPQRWLPGSLPLLPK